MAIAGEVESVIICMQEGRSFVAGGVDSGPQVDGVLPKPVLETGHPDVEPSVAAIPVADEVQLAVIGGKARHAFVSRCVDRSAEALRYRPGAICTVSHEQV